MALGSTIKNLNTVYSPGDAFGVKDLRSNKLIDAIDKWFSLYLDETEGNREDTSERLPNVIIETLQKAVFAEYIPTISDTVIKDGQRIDVTQEIKKKNDFIRQCQKNLDKKRLKMFQLACVGGTALAKPIIRNDEIRFIVIDARSYIVTERDEEGHASGYVTVDEIERNGLLYTVCEHRWVDVNGYCHIETKLFEKNDIRMAAGNKIRKSLGVEVQLSKLEEYANIPPLQVLPLPLWNTGLIPLSTPNVNSIDLSEDSVSIYANAVKAVEKSYKHGERTEWEFDSTRPTVFMSADLFQRDTLGNIIKTPDYVTLLNDDPEEVGKMEYAPEPKYKQLSERDNDIKRSIETLQGFRRGILSNVEYSEKTATEVKKSEGTYDITLQDFSFEMWEPFNQEVLRTCDILGQIYDLCKAGEYSELHIDWGNGILYDEQEEYQRLKEAQAGGLLRGEYVTGFIKRLPTETEEDLEFIRKKYMPTLSDTKDFEE